MNSILTAILIFYVVIHLAMSVVGFKIWRSKDRKMTFLSDENEPWYFKLMGFVAWVIIPHVGFSSALPITIHMLAYFRSLVDTYREVHRTATSGIMDYLGLDFIMGDGIDQHPDAKTRKTYN